MVTLSSQCVCTPKLCTFHFEPPFTWALFLCSHFCLLLLWKWFLMTEFCRQSLNYSEDVGLSTNIQAWLSRVPSHNFHVFNFGSNLVCWSGQFPVPIISIVQVFRKSISWVCSSIGFAGIYFIFCLNQDYGQAQCLINDLPKVSRNKRDRTGPFLLCLPIHTKIYIFVLKLMPGVWEAIIFLLIWFRRKLLLCPSKEEAGEDLWLSTESHHFWEPLWSARADAPSPATSKVYPQITFISDCTPGDCHYSSISKALAI